MKRLYTLLVLTGLWSAASAQQGGQSFTLEQCIQYALQNSINAKNATIDEEIAAARVKETRGIGLPQISGSVALQHNQKLARFFTTKQIAYGFSSDENKPPYDQFYPNLKDNDVVAVKQFFQLPSSGNASVTVNQQIFNASYLLGLKAANAYRELSVKTATQTKELVVANVTKAYYATLINRQRMLLFDNNIGRVDSLLRNTRAMNQSGFAEAIDVDRIQVSLNNLKTERDNFASMQELSLQLLKFQMNYPMDQNIDVSGDLASIQVDENVLNNYSANWDYAQRTDYQMLEANRRLLELDAKNQFSTGLPTLSAFATLGYSTQSPNISGLFKTNTNLDDNGSIGPDKWYNTSLYGVTLNVPIFSGLSRTYKWQQAKLALLKNENSFISLKSSIDLEVKQSATIYLNATRTLGSQQANMGLAQNVARITKIKYEQGVGSNIEVIDAENSLKTAQTNYYSALYDALIAKVDLDKAYGKFTPVATGTITPTTPTK